jgi:hypothetical protein
MERRGSLSSLCPSSESRRHSQTCTLLHGTLATSRSCSITQPRRRPPTTIVHATVDMFSFPTPQPLPVGSVHTRLQKSLVTPLWHVYAGPQTPPPDRHGGRSIAAFSRAHCAQHRTLVDPLAPATPGQQLSSKAISSVL